jgi:hypothetical protein
MSTDNIPGGAGQRMSNQTIADTFSFFILICAFFFTKSAIPYRHLSNLGGAAGNMWAAPHIERQQNSLPNRFTKSIGHVDCGPCKVLTIEMFTQTYLTRFDHPELSSNTIAMAWSRRFQRVVACLGWPKTS